MLHLCLTSPAERNGGGSQPFIDRTDPIARSLHAPGSHFQDSAGKRRALEKAGLWPSRETRTMLECMFRLPRKASPQTDEKSHIHSRRSGAVTG